MKVWRIQGKRGEQTDRCPPLHGARRRATLPDAGQRPWATALLLAASVFVAASTAAGQTQPATPPQASAQAAGGGAEPSPGAGGASADAPPPDGADKEVPGRGKRGRLSDELARQGEAELQRSVRVFQQRYLLKGGRLEVLVGGAASLADPMIGHLNVDAGLLFHLNERWAVGVSGSKPFGSEDETFESIQRDFGLFPERSSVQATGFAELQYAPIFGKFSSFGVAVVQMDVYGLLALGALRTSTSTAIKPAGQVGVGLRMHLLRALTLSIELRDTMMIESFQAGDRFFQHVYGGLKLGFWIPPSVQYRFQR